MTRRRKFTETEIESFMRLTDDQVGNRTDCMSAEDEDALLELLMTRRKLRAMGAKVVPVRRKRGRRPKTSTDSTLGPLGETV